MRRSAEQVGVPCQGEAAGTWCRPLLVAAVALFELVVVAIRVVWAFVVGILVDEDAFLAGAHLPQCSHRFFLRPRIGNPKIDPARN